MKTASFRLRAALAGAAVVAISAASSLAGSETPPAGPPWVREFKVAHRDALARGVPIFVYLTKTH